MVPFVLSPSTLLRAGFSKQEKGFFSNPLEGSSILSTRRRVSDLEYRALDFLSWYLHFSGSLSGLDCRHSSPNPTANERGPAQRPSRGRPENLAKGQLSRLPHD